MFTSELIAVTARKLCPRPLPEQVKRLADRGISRIILREKDLAPEEYLSLAESVLRACEECGSELTIHGFSEAAEALGIPRLHLPLAALTEDIAGRFDCVGTSVHSLEQLRRAESLGVSYAAAGHIFATDCKRGLPPRGLGFLAEICAVSSVPIYAIGGITAERLPEIIAAGAKGACIMSGAMTV